MNGSADGPTKDTDALERKTLTRLLATPPKPMKKAKEAAKPKKRGRPPKKEKPAK